MSLDTLDTDKLIRRSEDLSKLLGVASAIIQVLLSNSSESSLVDQRHIKWFKEAIHDVIYHDKPLPPFPENI